MSQQDFSAIVMLIIVIFIARGIYKFFKKFMDKM